MNPSRELLQRYSDETGHAISPIEKVARLGEFASNVGRHPLLGSVLALKGGTALNLCFGPPTRLSVDLDYNYIGKLERGKMLKERPNIVGMGLRGKVRDAGAQRGSLRSGCRPRGTCPRTPLPVRASRGCKASTASRFALEDHQREGASQARRLKMRGWAARPASKYPCSVPEKIATKSLL